MNIDNYIELGFNSKEEMQLYLDVFGGDCTKEKEPQSLEELLGNLNGTNVALVPKTKKDYEIALEQDKKFPQLIRMSLQSLLHSVAQLSEIDRLIVIWTYYNELGKVKSNIYDSQEAFMQDLMNITGKYEGGIDEYHKLHDEIVRKHKVGEYLPHRDKSVKACEYVYSRVSKIGQLEQQRFSGYIESTIDSSTTKRRFVSDRDKAFVESMSSRSREYRENLEGVRQERYQGMIDELDENQLPPFRRK